MKKARELGGFEGRGGKMRWEVEPIRSDCPQLGAGLIAGSWKSPPSLTAPQRFG